MLATQRSRRYPRVRLRQGILVAWEGSGERIVSRVGTIGLGGLFIQTPDPPSVGELLKLFFVVQGGEVRARGVVRSSLPGKGMGIEFTAMSTEARGRLRLFLKRLLAA